MWMTDARKILPCLQLQQYCCCIPPSENVFRPAQLEVRPCISNKKAFAQIRLAEVLEELNWILPSSARFSAIYRLNFLYNFAFQFMWNPSWKRLFQPEIGPKRPRWRFSPEARKS
jgi:hypothetical protein